MKEVWDFHGYVAVPLEYYGRKVVGESFMSADSIALGGFADGMIQILSVLYPEPSQIYDFLIKCSSLKGLSARQIGNDSAREVFDEFKKLYNRKMEG